MSTATFSRTESGGLGPGLFSLVAAIVLASAIMAGGFLGLAGLIGAILFGFFIYYPVFGLYMTVAALILQGSAGVLGAAGSGAVALTVAQLIGAAAMAAWLINLLIGKLPLASSRAMVLLLCFVVWALFGTILSEHFLVLLPNWARLLFRFALFVLAVNLLNTPKRVHGYIAVIVVCSLIMSLSAVAQYALPQLQTSALGGISGHDAAYVDQESLQGEAAVRVSGQAGHSNWLAFFILLVIPLALYWLHTTKDKRIKGLVLATLGLMLVSLVLTFTRTGLVIGVVLALMLAGRRFVLITPLRIFTALLGLVLIWVIVLPDAYKERVLSPKQYTQSRSVQSRMELQETAGRYFLENPVFGLGPGGFGMDYVYERSDTATNMYYMVRYSNWNPIFIGTHNWYLQLLCDYGLMGFIFFMCFFYVMFRNLQTHDEKMRRLGDRQGEQLTTSLLISLIAMLLMGVFLHALYQQIWWIIAAAAVAVPLYDIRFAPKAADGAQPAKA
ncbi:MAG: hypothetical protein GC168_04890 [Candidatus Hydrogenedens sp.]|nr:hypothetical protein [Candidatus Hydrogenedens sp.]